MTTNEMITRVGVKLNDPNADRFITSVRLEALNAAQEDIAARVNFELLKSLHRETGYTGIVGGNDLPSDYYQFINSYLTLATTYTEVEKLSADRRNQQSNSYLVASNSKPTCYIFGDKIYLLIATYITDARFFTLQYVKTLTTLVSDGNCDVDLRIHPYIVDLAEAFLRIESKFYDAIDPAQRIDEIYKKIELINTEIYGGKKWFC